jgi:hypothetical protein
MSFSGHSVLTGYNSFDGISGKNGKMKGQFMEWNGKSVG